MKISATAPEGNGAGEYRQIVRVPTGLYAGMFSRYSKPRLYKKYQSEENEEKFFVAVVLTHDAGARELTQFIIRDKPEHPDKKGEADEPFYSEGFAGIRTKAFYDPGTGMKSAYVAFFEALLNGKMTAEEIVDAAQDDGLPDLDDLIGQPLRVFITAATKPDKRGLFANKIDTGRGGFERIDKPSAHAVLPLWKAMDAQYSTEGLRYLKSPAAVYESDVQGGSFEGSDEEHADDDAIPF